MYGAIEYNGLFADCDVNGRLLICPGRHARGCTLHIWVMPEGGKPNHCGHAPENSVEVYGVVGGNPGWTESYGWLHKGPWQADFAKLVEERKAIREKVKKIQAEESARKAEEDSAKQKELLAKY